MLQMMMMVVMVLRNSKLVSRAARDALDVVVSMNVLLIHHTIILRRVGLLGYLV